MKNNIELQKFQYGLLVATPDDVQRTKNIGDYIQSIASAQFYPYVDELVHRETISSFVPKEKGIVKCIMNAWWMWNPQNWPPSDFLEALPISMHLSPIHAEELLAGEGLAWFKRNQPIGCRDYATKELFEKHGVSAYFSGCLTLTLGKTYRNMNPQGQNRVCFVDPYLHRDESKKRFLIYFHLLKAPYTILTLSRKDFFSTRWNNGVRNKNWLKNLLFATEFHKVYSSMFSNDVLRSAEYITHTIELDKDNDETLLRKAHILLQKYSTSRMVVTSRIHAGLPCLGMGTPVIFVTHEDLEGLNWNGGRLAGLLELFRKMELSGTKLVPKDNCFNFMGKIRKNSNFVNRDDWRKLSQNLSEACEDFVNDIGKGGGRRPTSGVGDVYSQASLAWRHNFEGVAGYTCSKVAIVSYNINSEHMNYGAALHSYAFQKILQRKGVVSTIVDYYPLELHGYSIKYPILNYKYVTTRKSAIKHILNWGGRGFLTNLRKYRKFAAFFRDHTVKTKKKYTYQDLMTMEKIEDVEYDTFVAESDVIWKNYWKEGYFDDVFYLNIPAAKGKRKVAYAPSMSSRPLTNEELKRFMELTSDYVAISTREKQSAEYLTHILNREISNLLDPTLLLEDSDYAEIAQRPKQDHYVLLYNCMHNDKEMVLEAERFAVEKNLPLVEVSNWNCNRYMHNHKVVVDAGIEEWLGWFKYADYVICNAFHGACFSVIFKKNFFVFQRDESDYRMLSIVMLLGLEDRLIKCNNKRIPKEVGDIEYGAVYDRLNQERQKSERFIEQYIVNHY